MYDQSIISFIVKGFVVCIAFSALLLLVLRILKIKIPKYVYVALVLLLLTWDNIYANIALYYYGLKDGGEHIYKVIENAEGFYHEGNTWGCDGTCEERLLERKFKFVECTVNRPTGYMITPQSAFYVDGPGLYRFSLAKKGSPLCSLYYEHNTRYPKQKDQNINDNPYCIASEKVTELKSKYAYSYHNFEKVLPFIQKATTIIKNIQTGEELGRAVTYQSYGGWLHYLYDGTGTVALYPRDFMIHSTILRKVLKH